MSSFHIERFLPLVEYTTKLSHAKDHLPSAYPYRRSRIA